MEGKMGREEDLTADRRAAAGPLMALMALMALMGTMSCCALSCTENRCTVQRLLEIVVQMPEDTDIRHDGIDAAWRLRRALAGLEDALAVPSHVVEDLPQARAALEALAPGRRCTAPGLACRARIDGKRGNRLGMRIEHPSDLRLALARARHGGGAVLLQRAVEGDSVLLLARPGVAVPRAVFEERKGPGPFRVTMALGVPASLAPEDETRISRLLGALVVALDGHDAAFEVEAVRENGVLKVADLRPQSREVAMLLARWEREARPVALGWVDSGSGTVREVAGADAAGALPGVLEVKVKVRPGEVLGHIVDTVSRDRLGYVLAAGDTAHAALATAQRAAGLIEVRTKHVIA